MRNKKARNVANISSQSHPLSEEMRCSGWAELVTSRRSTTNCQIPKTHKIGSEAQVVRWPAPGGGRGPIIWYSNIRRPWMRITQSPSCCSGVRTRTANKPSAVFTIRRRSYLYVRRTHPTLTSPLIHPFKLTIIISYGLIN